MARHSPQFPGDDPSFERARGAAREEADVEPIAKLTVNGPATQVVQKFHSKPNLIVGRSRQSDVPLSHPGVSFRHALFQLLGGRIYCLDLFSRMGTYWGRERRQSGWVRADSPIVIGPYTIRASLPEGEAESEWSGCHDLLAVFGGAFPTRGTQLVIDQKQGGSRWSVRRPIAIVGSDAHCHLRFRDPTVSRVHCTLLATRAGLWITDLLGREGTWVNGERVAFRLLRQDDVVQIGGARFRVDYSPAGFTPWDGPRPAETLDGFAAATDDAAPPDVPSPENSTADGSLAGDREFPLIRIATDGNSADGRPVDEADHPSRSNRGGGSAAETVFGWSPNDETVSSNNGKQKRQRRTSQDVESHAQLIERLAAGEPPASRWKRLLEKLKGSKR